MQHRYVALIIFACTFATLSPLRALAGSLPAIVLSEIQWGGSALSTADEWIELTNVSSESVDISSWQITGVASQEAEIIIPPETILPGYATYLVANYALGDAKTVLAVSPDLVTSSLSVSNSSLTITLVNATGIVIDSYSDEETPGIGSSSPHASAERDLESGNWFTAVTSQNMLTDEVFGSPQYALFPSLTADPSEQEVSLDIEVQDEAVIVEEISSSEVITETDLSAPEEVIVQTEEILIDVVEETALETDLSLPPIEEVVVLIAPVSSDVVTSSVEEVSEEDDGRQIEDALHDVEALDPGVRRDDDITTITTTLDYSLLRVTEFVSDPSDGKEWIELWNSGTIDLPLEGIVLTDASGKETILSGSLQSGAYVLIENPKGKLNNTNDTITLTLPDGQTLFTLTYGTPDFPAPHKGTSAGLCNDGWHTDLVPSPALPNSCPTTTHQLPTYDTEISHTSTVELSNTSSGTSPTIQGDDPNKENTDSSSTSIAQITTSVVAAASSEDSLEESSSIEASVKETSPTKSTVLSVAIADLERMASGQQVEVTGVVIAEPGLFGKRIAYLNGVQLYFHKATWPSLPLGTSVHITGTWDYDGDSRRIKISDSSDIEILGSETLDPTSWDDVSSETASDILVIASGTLLKKEDDIYLFSSLTGKDFSAMDEAETGSLTSLRAGDHVTITGILFPSDGNWILVPRSSDDIVLTVADIPKQEIPSSSLTTLAPTSSGGSTPIIGGGILASSVSALGYWFIRSKKLSFLFS